MSQSAEPDCGLHFSFIQLLRLRPEDVELKSLRGGLWLDVKMMQRRSHKHIYISYNVHVAAVSEIGPSIKSQYSSGTKISGQIHNLLFLWSDSSYSKS